MKLHLTDGLSRITVFFDVVEDMRDIQNIRSSARPVSTAFNLAMKRLGVESGLWPAPGLALEGL